MTGQGLKRSMLIQSWSQLVSWLAWLCIASLVALLVFSLLDAELSIPALFVAMAIGTLPPLKWSLPANFRVRSLRVRDVESGVMLAPRAIGSIAMAAEGEPTRYRQQVPQFVRWREEEIQGTPDREWLRVAGREMSLRNLRRKLFDMA